MLNGDTPAPKLTAYADSQREQVRSSLIEMLASNSDAASLTLGRSTRLGTGIIVATIASGGSTVFFRGACVHGWLAFALITCGCGDTQQAPAPIDAGPEVDGSHVADASSADAACCAPDGSGPDLDAPESDRSAMGDVDAGQFDAEDPDVGWHDAGEPDSPGLDADVPEARPTDPCATHAPATTVGCNGAPRALAPANTMGGACTVGDQAHGSCADTSLFCVYDTCAPLCSPTDSTRVSTGGCPDGFRCWDEGILTFCFPDCDDDGDCATGNCTAAGRCWF
jgi:hypothetical protein